jgi:hypothetical protein
MKIWKIFKIKLPMLQMILLKQVLKMTFITTLLYETVIYDSDSVTGDHKSYLQKQY